MSDERWRTIPAWEGLYEVSDQGRVRSLTRAVVGPNGSHPVRRGRLLTPTFKGPGYRVVSLSNGAAVKVEVHVLVAAAFIGPRPTPKHEVRHLDGNPSHNALTNLAYGTGSENWQDRRRHGRGAFALARGACAHGHPWTPVTTYLDRNGSPNCRICRSDSKRRRARA